jgi:hypothetical protein
MDVANLLDQLRKELEHLDAAIFSLEQLQANVEQARRAPPPRIRQGHLKTQSKTRPDGPHRSRRRDDG